MELIPATDHPIERRIYLWRVRLKLLQNNFGQFMQELLVHPTALIGGIIVIIYILAAVFAPLITSHNPALGDLHVRLIPPVWQNGGSWKFPSVPINKGAIF